MQASNKEDALVVDILSSVAKAEASRPMPPVPAKLEQWLQSQVQIKTPVRQSWLEFFKGLVPFIPTPPIYSANRRSSLRVGAAVGLGGALLGAAGVAWFTRKPSQAQESIPRWVDAIAQYQSLYVRETLTGTIQSSVQAQGIVRAFAQSSQLPDFMTPDLSSQGLIFQRAQRLNFDNIPLLQIVYLPAEGRPLALCAMPAIPLKLVPTADSSQPLASHGMTSSYWQRNGLAWVVVADWSPERLQTLVSQIQNKV